MKLFELETLVFVISAISLLFGWLMLTFYKMNPEIKGPLHWSLGSFSVVIASILFSFEHSNFGYIAYVLGGTFATLGMGLYWIGICVYKGLSGNYKILALIVFFQFFFSSVFQVLFPIPNARVVTYSFVTMTVCSLSFRELQKPTGKSCRLSFNLSSIAFVVLILATTFRVFYMLSVPPVEPNVPTIANYVVHFSVNVAQVLLVFSFMMMANLKVSERLQLKLESQHKFFSIIAHDLNGPVGWISMMLNLVNNDRDLSEKQKDKVLYEVEKLSGSAHHLLENLLSWSRTQLEDLLPNIQSFDLCKVIVENLELLQQLARIKNISIEYKQNANLLCLGDVRMIDMVIRNLVSNAIKFTNPGGKVTICGMHDGDKVVLKIIDNGIGMSEDEQKKLFKFNESVIKPGTQGERGTGLGLYLCYEFLQENSGSLHVRSQQNLGTEVTVCLPAC